MGKHPISLTAAALAFLGLSGAVGGSTVPEPVVEAIHGRVVGWAASPPDLFVVYLTGRARDWCGLDGATWRIGLVQTARPPVAEIAERKIGGAMCGNYLAWVQTGRFSDGRHREAAFMLWTTPSIGAWTYIYRIGGGRLEPLASFGGDNVVIGRGTVTVGFENRGRSPHGELRDLYRFDGTRYRLVRRK